MKNTFKDWFEGLSAVQGMLAGGVRRPDGKFAGFGDEKKYPAEKIEKLLHQFAGLHEPLVAAEFPLRWTTWAFEYGHLRFVLRPDEWLLMLLVIPESEAARELDLLSENFLARPFK